MKIGFDAKRAFLNATGLGNYSRSLIRGLYTSFPEHDYYLYSPALPENERTATFFQTPIHLRKAPWYMPGSLWRSRLVLPRLVKDGLSIYHGLSHELPFGLSGKGIKQLVTIHDLIFLRYPGLYPAADRRIYAAKLAYACRHADKIIAISEQTKEDIVHFLGVPPRKISVIYQSCSEAFKTVATPEQKSGLRQKYTLPETYLLQVGTIETRKNLLLTVQALRLLPPDISLVVVGKPTAYVEEVKAYLRQHAMVHRVLFLEGVLAQDLPILYQCAKIFVYPSRFEGFGLPILEALQSGVPVIAAQGSCLEEAGGPDSLYISPDEPEQLAAAVRQVLQADELRAEMIRKGKVYALQFESPVVAQQLMKVYQSL